MEQDVPPSWGGDLEDEGKVKDEGQIGRSGNKPRDRKGNLAWQLRQGSLQPHPGHMARAGCREVGRVPRGRRRHHSLAKPGPSPRVASALIAGPGHQRVSALPESYWAEPGGDLIPIPGQEEDEGFEVKPRGPIESGS